MAKISEPPLQHRLICFTRSNAQLPVELEKLQLPPVRRDCEELLRIQEFLRYTARIQCLVWPTHQISLYHTLFFDSEILWSSTRIATWRLQASSAGSDDFPGFSRLLMKSLIHRTIS